MLDRIKDARDPDRSGDARPERPLGPGARARVESASDRPTPAHDANGPRHRRAPGSSAPTSLAGWSRGGDRVRILDDLSIGQPAYLERRRRTSCVVGSLADPAAVRRRRRRRRRDRPPRRPGRHRRFGPRSARDLRGQRRVVGRPARGGAPGRASGGSCSPRRTPRPATTSHRATRPTCPTRVSPYGASKLAIEAYAGAYAATYGLVGLFAALLQRLRPELAPQAQRRRGLAAGRARRRADRRSTATAARRATSSTSTTSRRPSPPPSTHPRSDVAGELFQAGTGVETTVDGLANEIGRAVGRTVEIRPWTGPCR